MLETILGNMFIGGLLLVGILSLFIPIALEIKHKTSPYALSNNKIIFPLVGLVLVLMLLWTMLR